MWSHLVECAQWHLVNFSDTFDLILMQVLHHGPIFTLSKVPLRDRKQAKNKVWTLTPVKRALHRMYSYHHLFWQVSATTSHYNSCNVQTSQHHNKIVTENLASMICLTVWITCERYSALLAMFTQQQKKVVTLTKHLTSVSKKLNWIHLIN